MDITIRVEWDMGHRLPNHGGGCRNLHGHRYAAEVTLRGNINDSAGEPDEGMVLDFGPVKTLVRELLQDRDHRFLLCQSDPLAAAMADLPGMVFVPWIPTAENIAHHLLQDLRNDVSLAAVQKHEGISVVRLRLYETPTSYAEAT